GMMCTGSEDGFLISTAGIVICTATTSSGTLTVCPGSGPVGTTVTIFGQGCAGANLEFLGPSPNNESGGGVADIEISAGAGNDFAGTWSVPPGYSSVGNPNTPLAVTPSSNYQFQTSTNACHVPFRVTSGQSSSG
ncbi:MAG: hypothetical protein ACRDZ8_08575, partial [Acidimicrobiales bacterium]